MENYPPFHSRNGSVEPYGMLDNFKFDGAIFPSADTFDHLNFVFGGMESDVPNAISI